MGDLVRRPGADPAKKAPVKKAPAKKAPAKKAPAKKAPAKKAPAKKAPAKKAPAKKAPAKKAPAKKAAKKGPAKKAPAKKAARERETRARPDSGPTKASGPAMGLPALPAPPIDPLVILGLAESHSAAELRRAWRAYASRHHPDQGGDAATFSRGRAAYQTLLGRTKNRS